jgi:hypothetical protein
MTQSLSGQGLEGLREHSSAPALQGSRTSWCHGQASSKLRASGRPSNAGGQEMVRARQSHRGLPPFLQAYEAVSGRLMDAVLTACSQHPSAAPPHLICTGQRILRAPRPHLCLDASNAK